MTSDRDIKQSENFSSLLAVTGRCILHIYTTLRLTVLSVAMWLSVFHCQRSTYFACVGEKGRFEHPFSTISLHIWLQQSPGFPFLENLKGMSLRDTKPLKVVFTTASAFYTHPVVLKLRVYEPFHLIDEWNCHFCLFIELQVGRILSPTQTTPVL